MAHVPSGDMSKPGEAIPQGDRAATSPGLEPAAEKQKTHLTPANTLNVSQIRPSFVYV